MRKKTLYKKKYFTISVLILCCGILGGCALLKSKKEWKLEDGTKIRLLHESNYPAGRDDKKTIEILYPSGDILRKYFGEHHAGYTKVELFVSAGKRYIWLIDKSSPNRIFVGPGFDLEEGVFYDEGEIEKVDGLNISAPDNFMVP